MADLPKRQLGRTGSQVAAPGYGWMELRGVPRARDTTEAQAATALPIVRQGHERRIADRTL